MRLVSAERVTLQPLRQPLMQFIGNGSRPPQYWQKALKVKPPCLDNFVTSGKDGAYPLMTNGVNGGFSPPTEPEQGSQYHGPSAPSRP